MTTTTSSSQAELQQPRFDYSSPIVLNAVKQLEAFDFTKPPIERPVRRPNP
jgi:hypothetical protein